MGRELPNFWKGSLTISKTKKSYTHESTMVIIIKSKKDIICPKWKNTYLGCNISEYNSRAAILHICRGMNPPHWLCIYGYTSSNMFGKNRKTRLPVPDEKIKNMHRNCYLPLLMRDLMLFFHMKTNSTSGSSIRNLCTSKIRLP